MSDLLEEQLRRGPSAAHTEGGSTAALELLLERIGSEDLADVVYTELDSPFGPLQAAATRRGLVHLAFPEQDRGETLALLARRISPRIVRAPRRLEQLRRELAQYFEGTRREFEVALDWSLIGPFATRVLRRTASIPYGGHLSYAEVAAAAGSPGGARAAGNALGSNPIPIVIPCHRVLRAGGALGGYGGGLERKRLLLELEGALTPPLSG